MVKSLERKDWILMWAAAVVLVVIAVLFLTGYVDPHQLSMSIAGAGPAPVPVPGGVSGR